MGFSSYSYLGPYLVLPTVEITFYQDVAAYCHPCQATHHDARFCPACGTALQPHKTSYTQPLGLHHIAHEIDAIDVWFEPELGRNQRPVVLPNHAARHYTIVDHDDGTLGTTPLDPGAIAPAMDWYAAQTAPIQDWLQANNHPPATLHYGMVCYVL